MGEVAQNFIRRFHSLQGDRVKERHQNFFHLLHEHLHLKNIPHELEFITGNLNVTSFLEKILRVDYLIYFQQFNELYDDFVKGDEITVKKVSKQAWFFQKAFKDVTPEVFVNSIMPTLSYSMKVKILRKLPIIEPQGDKFFDAVYEQYGLFLATALLSKCTSQKIQEVFMTYSVKLSVRQLKAIFNKNPDLIAVYLDERIKHEGSTDFLQKHHIFVYIAQQNPDIFCKLYGKYHFSKKIGRRTTKRIICFQKDKVLTDLEKYFNILNKPATVRKMDAGIRDIIFKKDWIFTSPHFFAKILNYYPKPKQFDLYKSVHDSLSCKKIGENLDYICECTLKLISDPDERETLAKKKMEKDGNDNYLKYVKPDYCLKLVMEKINHVDYGKIITYIGIAMRCCILNEDVHSLLKVLEVVCVRFNHYREIEIILLSILSSPESRSMLDKLSKKHWQCIIEVANGRFELDWRRDEYVLISKYINFCVKNNISVKEIVEESFKWEKMPAESFYELNENPKLFKLMINELIDIGATKTKPYGETEPLFFYGKLARICEIYNEKNPNDTIDVWNNSKIMKAAKDLLQYRGEKWPGWDCILGVQYIVCQTRSSQELKEMYFTSLKKYGTLPRMIWFLKHEPKTIQANFDQFLENIFSSGPIRKTRLWRFLKKFDHLDLRQRACSFFKQKMSVPGPKDKIVFVEPMAILEAPAISLGYIKQYIPVSETIDTTDNDTKALCGLQRTMVESTRFLNSPSEVLPVIFMFCKGDYFKSALGPLFKCMYKLPEDETKPFIGELSETGVLSAKKHSLHLCCDLCDAKTVLKCLETATAPSLIVTLKYFTKNPSSDLWLLIETLITAMEKKHSPLLKAALRVKVPYEYKGKHIQIIWKAAEKLDDKVVKKILMKRINKEIIRHLDPEFAFHVIQSVRFETQEACTLVANLLLYLKTDEKYVVLSNVLAGYKKKSSDNPDTRKAARRKLNTFVLTLFEVYMAFEESDKQFVSELITLFDSTSSLCDVLREVILIRCMVLKGETPENGAKILTHLNNILCKKFGLLAVNISADLFNNHVSRCVFVELGDKIKLCHFLLKCSSSVGEYLFLIKVLAKIEPKSKENYVLCKDILSQLSQVSDDEVQLEFNLFLKTRV